MATTRPPWDFDLVSADDSPRSDGRVGAGPASSILSVSQLNREAARLLQAGLGRLWVGGELSNVTRAASGHWYFTLKDSRAAVRAVMFRQAASRVDFRPVEGLQVEVLANAGVYEARGDFQLQVERMREAGTGDLYRQFVRLKAKLEAEGLFDAERKRPLPPRILRVGVVTSPRGAAVRDVLATLRQRAPRLEVVLYPASVQGDRAPPELVSALDAADLRAEVDVVLLVRGGGSIEDLWAFNDERVARRISAMGLPVVSGVGHETDFSISDFVADWRAATPTAAAVLVSRDGVAERAAVERLAGRLGDAMLEDRLVREQAIDRLGRALRPPRRLIADQRLGVEGLLRRLGSARLQQARLRQQALAIEIARLRPPELSGARATVATLGARLERTVREQGRHRELKLAHLTNALELVNPGAILERGYSLTFAEDGRLVRDPAEIVDEEVLRIEVARGSINARATVGKPGAMRKRD